MTYGYAGCIARLSSPPSPAQSGSIRHSRHPIPARREKWLPLSHFRLPPSHFRLIWVILAGLGLFPLAAQDAADVQVGMPGEFTAPFEYLNNMTNGGIDLNNDGKHDVVDPCSCREQPFLPTDGTTAIKYFDDQILIATGISGQQWRLQSSFGIFHPQSFLPYVATTPIPEVANGVYVLPFAHQSGQGYFALVEAPINYPGQLFGPVTNTCYYPRPFIEGLDDFFCTSEGDQLLQGTTYGGFDDMTTPLTNGQTYWVTQRKKDGATFFSNTFSPSTLGEGTYTVRMLYDGGDHPHEQSNKTGCVGFTDQQVIVRGSPNMACISQINVSIGEQCNVLIIPQMLLASQPATYEGFSVKIFAPDGTNLGDRISADYHNVVLEAVVTDSCSGVNCSTFINARDVTPPVLKVPQDRIVNCITDTEPATTGWATATDCTETTISYTDQVTNSECGNPIMSIRRTWTVRDKAGNFRVGLQTISVQRGSAQQLRFPADVTISCSDYFADPSRVEPTAEGAGMPNLVDQPRCGMIYTHDDDIVPLCGDPTKSFVIVRTWTVLDRCGNNIYDVDGAGFDNVQMIRVVDQQGPTVDVAPIRLNAETTPGPTGGNCVSLGFLPAPTVTNECNAFSIRILTPLGEADYVNGQHGAEGGYVPQPGLGLGQHEIIYEVTDACGNLTRKTTTLTVVDEMPPVMLCNGALTVRLSNDGTARLGTEDIDEGSRDDCCTANRKVKLQSEEDNAFRNFIDFNCTNATVPIVMRLWDCAGNFNDCISQVTIEDPTPVQLVSGPPDTTVSCLQDYQIFLHEDFRPPVFRDNCTFDVTFAVTEQVNDCGIGYLERSWTARDNQSNRPAVFIQRVNLAPEYTYTFLLPTDFTVSCTRTTFDDIILEDSSGCTELRVSVTEEIIPDPDNDACYQIKRIHSLLNDCEYDGVSPPTVLPRLDGPDGQPGGGYRLRSDGERLFEVIGATESPRGPSTGYYQYVQYISVNDQAAPTVLLPADTMICLAPDSGDCRAETALPVTIDDDCAGEMVVRYRIRLNNQQLMADTFGQLVAIDSHRYELRGRYPMGSHTFIFDVADACGNLSTESFQLTVGDCTGPVVSCTQRKVFVLDENGEVTVSPQDLITSAVDACSPATTLGFSPTDTLGEERLTFTCDSLGEFRLSVYAFDAALNQSVCTAIFTVGDARLVCSTPLVIDGVVHSEDTIGLAGAIVKLDGNYKAQVTTDEDGYFVFHDVPRNGSYSVAPYKNDDPLNGVSTFDIVILSKHILTVERLTSPYRIIGGDINVSRTVSTLDIIRLRRLILSIDTSFQGNTSWRFVPTAYQFPQPDNPFAAAFPEKTDLPSLQNDTTIHFTALKVGDMNLSAKPNDFLPIDERDRPFATTVAVETPDVSMAAGETATLRFTVAAGRVDGGQLSLRFPADQVEVLGIEPTAWCQEGNFNLTRLADGLLTLSWTSDQSADRPAFALQVRARRAGRLSDWFAVADDPTPAEVYLAESYGQWTFARPQLHFTAEASAPESVYLAPPSPNPFGESVAFAIELTEAGPVELTIVNAQGQVVYQQQKQLERGLHQWAVTKAELPVRSGVFFYRLKAGGREFSGRLVKVE